MCLHVSMQCARACVCSARGLRPGSDVDSWDGWLGRPGVVSGSDCGARCVLVIAAMVGALMHVVANRSLFDSTPGDSCLSENTAEGATPPEIAVVMADSL